MKIKKKIIIFMPSIEGGGVEKNLFIISNFIAKSLKNVYLITASKNYNKKFKNIKIINPLFKYWQNSNRRVKYFICLYELLKIILFDRKILVFSFQANIYCLLICKLFNVKVIMRSNSSPSGWSKNYFKNIIFKNILKLADEIIVNSLEFKKEFLSKFNIKSTCIYNPLNKNEVVKFSRFKVKFPYFQNYKKLKIINIGRFTDQKDHITFLKSLNILKKKIEFRSLIIGRGKNKKKMFEFIRKNNLKNFVKIIGFQLNPYKYLNMADILVLTSKFEGLPNVMLEAVCLKKFVISTNCPTGPKEILMNGAGGMLCKIENPQDISKKIFKYAINKKLYNKKKIISYYNLYRFDYNQNLKKYLKLINKIYKLI